MKDDRDLLEVLKFELEFLEKGGYGRSPRQRWRVPRIFEDSPTCLNFDLPEKVYPCSECALMHLVPKEDREKSVPCDFIPLNECGETVDGLYRYAGQDEIEEKMKVWLRVTIQRMEEERAAQASANANDKESPGTFVRCANPVCLAPFDPHADGRFFRFQVRPEKAGQENAHGVMHYWLCSNCKLLFTLVEEPGRGPVLRLRWLELPEGQRLKELKAS